MRSNLTIWCNASFSDEVTDELKSGIGNHRLVIPATRSNNLGAAEADPLLGEADIAFGQPDPLQISQLTRLDWIHLTSAGYTRYDTVELRSALKARSACLTNSSSVFDNACAQHVLAFMLAQARQLPISFESQLGSHGWVYDRLRSKKRVLENETVLILGYGAIARRLVELLAPFGLSVVAVRRTVRGDEIVSTHPVAEISRLLPVADHVVNLLPLNPSADGVVDDTYFRAMKPGAFFYNVGRGATVNQEALVTALTTGNLGAAYLDVTDPEPLPPDHPLWTTPNCWITPHVAGGHQAEESHMVRHFLSNLRRYEKGEPLLDLVV